MRLGLATAAAVLLLDQVSKYLIVERLMRPEGVVGAPFFTPRSFEITPFFNLVMVWNRGISFGILNNDSPYNAVVFGLLALAVTVGLGIWLHRTADRLMAVTLGLIMGGALGNAIDRLHFGAVADFLDFHLAGHHWPAFNLADAAISVGAALLVAEALFRKRDRL